MSDKRNRDSGSRYATTPAGQREQCAKEIAIRAAKYYAGPPLVKLPPDRPAEKRELAKADPEVLTQGADSAVLYELEPDKHYSDLVKAYGPHGIPEVPTMTRSSVHYCVCSDCENVFSKAFTICPSCGHYSDPR